MKASPNVARRAAGRLELPAMHHVTLRAEMAELALARGQAQDLAAKGRTDLGIKLLDDGLA